MAKNPEPKRRAVREMSIKPNLPICAHCGKKIYARHFANLDGDKTKPMHESCAKSILTVRYGRQISSPSAKGKEV